MAAATTAAKVAIRKVQEKRRVAYEESIMTPEQREERKRKRNELKKEIERSLRAHRQKVYKSLAVFDSHERIITYFADLRDSFHFQIGIIGVIILAGLLVGFSTYNAEGRPIKITVVVLEFLVLLIFVIEIAVKLIAEGKKPWQYFHQGWNIFDFSIVLFGFFQSGMTKVVFVNVTKCNKLIKNILINLLYFDQYIFS